MRAKADDYRSPPKIAGNCKRERERDKKSLNARYCCNLQAKDTGALFDPMKKDELKTRKALSLFNEFGLLFSTTFK